MEISCFKFSFQLSPSLIPLIYNVIETAFTTKRSKESDVYSYGVVLLELLTRKEPVKPSLSDGTDLVSWVCANVENSNGIDQLLEVVCDPGLLDEVMGSAEMEEVHKVLLLAVRCTSRVASERPSMRDVVKELTDIKSNAGNGGFQKK